MSEYKQIKEYLNKCLEHNMLSHAYIFHGSDEVSKRETAFWFANKLLSNDKNFHPDLFLLKPDNQNGITIDLIRQLKKFAVPKKQK